ncbi:MAG TPA: response regulator [Gaiellaceae bacterium]|nr:response regulator [Gaiellaceae bacterium]
MQQAPRILVVDDDASVRALLRSLIEAAGYLVAGEAANGAEGVELYARLDPDAVTMDLEMPVMDGVAATREICACGCCPVVVVSGSQSSENIGAAMAAGARWHVAKRDVVAQLVPVLDALLRPERSPS